MNKELEKEVGYIDNNDIFLTTNRIDNILLQRQKITVKNSNSVEYSKVYNCSSFLNTFHYTLNYKNK